MKNGRVKKELARCLDCFINKYCETLEEINRLEGLINMVVLINIEKEYEDRLREEGRAEGRVELARQFVKEFGAEKVSKITGIDKELLL